jgi:hypothetical protein
MEEKIDVQLITAPLKNLRESAMNIDRFVLFNNFRWFADMRDDFSWVYGLSEVEINDFLRQYNNTKSEIKNIINNTQNEKLKVKLILENESLPSIDSTEFTVNLDKRYWILNMLRPFKKIRKSLKFKEIINDINRTCERMINYIENVEWLEYEK